MPTTGVFHLTFFVALHSSGRFFSAEMPEPSGPRHPGQFASSAASDAAVVLEKATAQSRPTVMACLMRPDNFTSGFLNK
ncbi:MAG: hypothetical protein H0T60_08945 [Acidobacteria bacterium]|nr:hypothetical protein [Acidobacteriota bacterium]